MLGAPTHFPALPSKSQNQKSSFSMWQFPKTGGAKYRSQSTALLACHRDPNKVTLNFHITCQGKFLQIRYGANDPERAPRTPFIVQYVVVSIHHGVQI